MIKVHRYFGLSAAFLMLFMVVSGWLLVHSNDFELDKNYVENEVVLDWYGIYNKPIYGYAVAGHWFSSLGNGVYLDQNKVADSCRLHGVARSNAEWVLACEEGLLLLTAQGKLIEQLLPGAGLPDVPMGIQTLNDGTLLLKGRFRVWQVDSEWLNWQAAPQEVVWPEAKLLPEALQLQLQNVERYQSIQWERFLLDLHSGRLLGGYLIDVVALLLLLMAISGWAMWLKRRRVQRQQRLRLQRQQLATRDQEVAGGVV
ncbi:MAG: PepSY domain-containing protein [Gammaproteobacteria bacterium]|nr:PepSY domain-containing protein [Gammaproteobacteria bacterium]